MKVAIVVQRYGADINGGAEQHARYIAERLSRHASVEVVTTCARDYVTWKNDLPAGVEQVNGIRVRRFPVAHERKPNEFGRRSVQVVREGTVRSVNGNVVPLGHDADVLLLHGDHPSVLENGTAVRAALGAADIRVAGLRDVLAEKAEVALAH